MNECFRKAPLQSIHHHHRPCPPWLTQSLSHSLILQNVACKTYHQRSRNKRSEWIVSDSSSSSSDSVAALAGLAWPGTLRLNNCCEYVRETTTSWWWCDAGWLVGWSGLTCWLGGECLWSIPYKSRGTIIFAAADGFNPGTYRYTSDSVQNYGHKQWEYLCSVIAVIARTKHYYYYCYK